MSWGELLSRTRVLMRTTMPVKSLSWLLPAPALIWHLRGPFLCLNWLQWALMAPWRPLIRNLDGDAAHRWFRWLLPLGLAYWLAAYLALAPLRLVNAVYFDLALFWTVALRDGLADLIFPGFPGRRGRAYLIAWVARFPVRLVSVSVRCVLALLQGLCMAAFDLVWPAVTLFHGTEFYDSPQGMSPAKDILRFNRWRIGPPIEALADLVDPDRENGVGSRPRLIAGLPRRRQVDLSHLITRCQDPRRRLPVVPGPGESR